MQLIIETENTSIDLREKMTTLDQESVDKLIINGDLQSPVSDVPNGNKENIRTKNNIIVNNEENTNLNETKQTVVDIPTATAAVENVSEEGKIVVSKYFEKEISIDENTKESTSNIASDNVYNEKNITSQVNEKPQREISQDTDNIDISKDSNNKIYFDSKNEPADSVDNNKSLEETLNLDNSVNIEVDKVYNKLQNDDNYPKNDPNFESNQNLEEIGHEKENEGDYKEDYSKKEISPLKKAVAVKKVTESLGTTIQDSSTDNISQDMDCGDVPVMLKMKSGEILDANVESSEATNSGKKNFTHTSKDSERLTDLALSASKVSGEKKAQTSMECETVTDLKLSENKNPAQTPMDFDEEIQIPKNDGLTETEKSNESDDIAENIENFIQTLKSDDNDKNMAVNKNKDSSQTSMDCDEETIEATNSSEIVAKVECSDTIEDFIEVLSSDDASGKNDVTNESTKITGSENQKNSLNKCDQKNQMTTDNQITTETSVEYKDVTGKTDNIPVLHTQGKAESQHAVQIVTKENIKSENFEHISILDSEETMKKEDAQNVRHNIDISEAHNTTVHPSENIDTAPNDMDNYKGTTNKSNATDSNTMQVDSKEDIDEVRIIEDEKENPLKNDVLSSQELLTKKTPIVCRLSNTLDILSDDDDEIPTKETSQNNKITTTREKQCINIEDDDDIMVIDEEKDDKTGTVQPEAETLNMVDDKSKPVDSIIKDDSNNGCRLDAIKEKDSTVSETEEIKDTMSKTEINETETQNAVQDSDKLKPLVSDNFFTTYKKNLADMTRDDLEEFCILKIVESIIDRSNLNDIRTKLKNMAQNIEEYKKKAMMLTKQNRDLQVVLKSVQEEQKKGGESPIVPLKITRSVGMQVLMTDKNSRRKGIPPPPSTIFPTPPNNSNTRQIRNAINQNSRQQSQANNNQQIPVPRLVPATNNTVTKSAVNSAKNTGKATSSITNGVKVSPPPQKVAEKRSYNRMQSVTVDLTDDEPPSKVSTKASVAPPVRLVPPQNLMAPRQQAPQQTVNSPRKVYIPISGPQGQNVRPNQTIMLKSVPSPGPRQRGPSAPMVRLPQNPVRMTRVLNGRHPAPLPDAMKQYQPPNWKALPPAPDLKLSKVENGIVISWKIDGYQEDSYEEIASYQLYAYQETSSPPNTALWKKIGDVKALPLPMACTLTQFMAGYKYYFAVRAVDIRSRLGPFSLPGSILLLNKM